MSYEELFEEIMQSLTTEQEKLDFFSDPAPRLIESGIPMISAFDATKRQLAVDLSDPAVQCNIFKQNFESASTSNQAELKIDTHWWGITLIMNEELTQRIIHAVDDTGNIASIIAAGIGSLISGPAAIALGLAFALAFIAKREQIKFVDKGKGVNFPISYIQWAGLTTQIPGGVGALVVAILALVHPFSN